ncbi:unnamed protein product, partial [Ectocarpus sp. 13 AM-2016]
GQVFHAFVWTPTWPALGSGGGDGRYRRGTETSGDGGRVETPWGVEGVVGGGHGREGGGDGQTAARGQGQTDGGIRRARRRTFGLHQVPPWASRAAHT